MEPLGFRDQSDVLSETPDALANFKLLKGAMTRSLNAEQVVDNAAGLETSSRLESTIRGLELSPGKKDVLAYFSLFFFIIGVIFWSLTIESSAITTCSFSRPWCSQIF